MIKETHDYVGLNFSPPFENDAGFSEFGNVTMRKLDVRTAKSSRVGFIEDPPLGSITCVSFWHVICGKGGKR